MSDPVRSTPRSPVALAIKVAIAFAVIAVLSYAYASPYIALDRLKRAADARDAQTLNQYVDYPALRQSLKDQVTQLLTRRIDEQKLHNPFAAIGAMIGMALVGPLVDAYATPDGVAAILDGMPPRGTPGEHPPEPGEPSENMASNEAPSQPGQPASAPATSSSQPASAPVPPKTTAGYRGVNEFAVTYQRSAGNAQYSAILHRDGLFSWKLVAVELNG
ncbi:DUF2939 domain-containing protein [Trinickia violacea]|uniref:DUF2939 domain-containing protein n=1 Tax=Trinickia violacea TaxID=2571746 RepID=A0A4P8IKK8_9BURK|nr:DUF2939 domain-containing protein [Trinickia violacea]QCP49398.1 DUF2939 domain-containing protein [Trinickia violacea]